MLTWTHNDVTELHGFGKYNIGKIPHYESLKMLRAFIKRNSKSVPLVEFIDELDFSIVK